MNADFILQNNCNPAEVIQSNDTQRLPNIRPHNFFLTVEGKGDGRVGLPRKKENIVQQIKPMPMFHIETTCCRLKKKTVDSLNRQ